MATPRSRTYSAGVDFGTNSCRALIVDTATGAEIGTAVYAYPSGKDGILLDPKDPNLARQNPADYLNGFFVAMRGALRQAKRHKSFSPEHLVGIGIDGTGATPLPVNQAGTPLAFLPKFKKNLAAQAWLWKDHTAHVEAAAITATAQKMKVPYLQKCGGTYSSEWFWAKVWHCQKIAPQVFKAAYSWVEMCDFITAYLSGNTDPLTLKRSLCLAGHKAMYNDEWGGLPAKSFLKKLSPALGELRDRLYKKAVPSDQVAGFLSAEVAKKSGLPVGIPIAVGALDAHYGAVGSGVKDGTLVKILGTSTCDLLVVPTQRKVRDIPGVCGVAPGSVIPGMLGIEAGQSAVGDIFNWFVANLCPPEYAKGDRHVNLTKAARKIKPGASGLLALDWNNGNRTILVDPLLSGLLIGQTLHTTAPEIYRALVEATAFGALTIIRRLEEYDVAVKEVITCGGIAEKNDFIMQIYADVLNRPMKIARSSQACALGAAIFGAVVGGVHKTTPAAIKKMTGVKKKIYKPQRTSAKIYAEIYPLYRALHDAFGCEGKSETICSLMKKLLAIRDRTRK